LTVAVWDFDYDRVVLDLRPGGDQLEGFCVSLPSPAPVGATLSHHNARSILERLVRELKPFLGGAATADERATDLASATEHAIFCALYRHPQLHEPSVDGFFLHSVDSQDATKAAILGVVVRLDGSCEPAKLLVHLDERTGAVTFLKLWLGDAGGRVYGLSSWRGTDLPTSSSEWRTTLEFTVKAT
jgi:hypothetical protein